MAYVYAERVRETSTTEGAGTLNLSGAVTGYRTFVAGIGTGNTCKFEILDANGTAWERSYGTVTDAAPDTLTRTLIASSTGSLISLSAGTHTVFCDWSAQDAASSWEVDQTYIRGLLVSKNSGGNTLDISAGACFDPSSNKVITYAGATAVSAGTLGASQWNQVYLYDVAGTATVEVVNNAAPPATAYSGTARQGGTNSNRRWIGSFLTTSGSALHKQAAVETAQNQFVVQYDVDPSASPFRTISGGTATTYTAVSQVGWVPRYVATEILIVIQGNFNTTAAAYIGIALSANGNNRHEALNQWVENTADSYPSLTVWAPLESATPQIWYKVNATMSGVGPNCYVDGAAYRGQR